MLPPRPAPCWTSRSRRSRPIRTPPTAGAATWTGHRRRRSALRTGRRTSGTAAMPSGPCCAAPARLLITAGMVLLLFVVYEVWVSNLFADRKQQQVHQQLATAWRTGQDPLKGQDRLNLPIGKQVVLPVGDRFANSCISPAFWQGLRLDCRRGHRPGRLGAGGPRYYTVHRLYPGQQVNFALGRLWGRAGFAVPAPRPAGCRCFDAVVVHTAGNWDRSTACWVMLPRLCPVAAAAHRQLSACCVRAAAFAASEHPGRGRPRDRLRRTRCRRSHRCPHLPPGGSTPTTALMTTNDLPSEVQRDAADDHPRRPGVGGGLSAG